MMKMILEDVDDMALAAHLQRMKETFTPNPKTNNIEKHQPK